MFEKFYLHDTARVMKTVSQLLPNIQIKTESHWYIKKENF
jgi:hypothetical protein